MNALRALTWVSLLLLAAAAFTLALGFDDYNRDLFRAAANLAALGTAGLAFAAWLQSRK